MALINCSECGSQISSNAQSCPKCGNPTVSNSLFAKDKTEDAHIKKIYSYVRAGKTDKEIAELLNSINIKPIDEPAWTQGLIESIRKKFKLDKSNPVFLNSLQSGKKTGRLIWLVLGISLAAFLVNRINNTETKQAEVNSQNEVTASESETIRQLIQANGYTCTEIEAIHRLLISEGYSVYCDDYIYHYEAENQGGKWQVVID